MPVGINQPSGQVKLTNVSIVRLKKGKKRFELVCYKNKLLDYRSGAETELGNVLPETTVYLSVSKAQRAPSAELAKAFGSDAKPEEIIQEILRKGEVQVGERERKNLSERVESEVVEIVRERLVDPESKRLYTSHMIRKALDQLRAASGQQQSKNVLESSSDDPTTNQKKPLWSGVVTTKSAKSQALEAMKALIAWQPIPVMRARMRLRITCPASILKQVIKSTTSNGGETGKGLNKSKKAKGKGKEGDESDQGPNSDREKNSGPKTVKERILSHFEEIECQEILGHDEWEVVGFAQPGAYKGLSDFMESRGRLEVLDMAVIHEE